MIFYVTRELRVTCLKLQVEFKMFVDFLSGQMFQRNVEKSRKKKKQQSKMCHFSWFKWSLRP